MITPGNLNLTVYNPPSISLTTYANPSLIVIFDANVAYGHSNIPANI